MLKPEQRKRFLNSPFRHACLAIYALLSCWPLLGHAEENHPQLATCAGCHGKGDGAQAVLSEYPNLNGQHKSYLLKELHNMKAGKGRKNALMASFLTDMTEQDMEILSDVYSQFKPIDAVADPSKDLNLGRQIYLGGLMEKGVPACAACHGPTGLGNSEAHFPKLKGQHAAYTVKALKEFKNKMRSNDPNGIMRDIASRLTDLEMEAVASYAEGLRPAKSAAKGS